MAVAGFYRRTLPSPPAIEFASPQGKQLFSEALEGGTMEGFFKLISYYQTQSEPAYCGLATLSVVLNALSIDPGRTWKGPWRWFDDSMLDCCEPLSKIKAEGITFGKVACLAYCNGANVEAFRTNETSLDDFRRLVVSSASSEDCHVIASYHRGVLKQTGTGHFSPIGGYHAGRDMVLILDVARFKYPPHWVPLTLLWEAMNTIDQATGHHRGFMIISRLQKASSIFYIQNCRHEVWRNVAKYLTEDVPQRLKPDNLKDVENILSVVFKPAPYDLKEFIKWVVAEVRRQEDPHGIISEEEKGRLLIKEKVLKQIRDTELFKFVSRWLASEILLCEDVIALDCQESLPKTASDVCCQSAELSAGKPSQLDGTICKEKNLALVKSNGEKPSNLCDINQSKCKGMHPSTGDVLTVLLFALPQHTWSGIKEEKLVEQFSSLLSIENLPSLLEEEASMEGSLNIEPLWTDNVNHTAITFVNGILHALKSTIQSGKRVSHLRRQLHFLMIDLSDPKPSA